MDKKTDIRLIYEWNTRRAKLDFAIKEVEHQLASVNKRLQSLQHDLFVYVGFLTVPLILYKIFSFLLDQLFSFEAMVMFSLIYVLLELICTIIIVVYIIGFPFNLYHLIKTILLLKANKESIDMEDFTPPPLQGTLRGNKAAQESTYRSEYNKLVYVLTRYYLYQETMDNLLKQINSGSCTMTLADLKLELNKLPFYEDICPANAFSSAMAQKAQRTTFLILFGIVVLVVIIIIFVVL